MATLMAKKQTSYATFGLMRSWRQVVFTMKTRKDARKNMQKLFAQVKKDESLIAKQLGRPVKDLQILEIGPGQGMERAKYFGMQNRVTGLDLDVIPMGWDLKSYLQVLRQNGVGRLLKTVGRKALIAPLNDSAWKQLTGAAQFEMPRMIYGNVCETELERANYDLVMSWSVFEHLPDPEYALRNIQAALKPGGVFLISIHLFTAINGSHDIRAFTGMEEELPLWGHLRAAHRSEIVPSAYLNEWRLERWRELFSRLTPGHEEILECYEYPQKYGPMLNGQLEAELAGFTREELLAVDLKIAWRKPGE